jgi:hypothetical protein
MDQSPLPKPSARKLRVYAFDPNASLDLASSKFSHATISLAWDDPTEEDLRPGPINEYLEVIDIDPPSQQFYEPVDLMAAEVLGQDGLPPSEGDPRFHQQMVFAVAMKTIRLFERALGRRVLWAPVWDNDRKTYVPTKKLRVYPHALREANAYYSRAKRALLFGYFNTTGPSAGASWIFTALSHDIIVHETTHAILDGLHPRYSEPTSADSLAFHEAFADIAALFSHFQLYEAVYDFIERNGGELNQSGLLSGLASQFAKGTSNRAALRDFIDKDPDPRAIDGTTEAHERGAILVAAVFDAFLSIYRARTEPFLRLSGIQVGAGTHLHPDLVAILAKEAGKSADHVLRMCIRALDYLPPVDVRFGEFLRGIITADNDLIPDDRLNYRLAFVEAFRRRGILAENCLSMSPDNLLWDTAPDLPIGDLKHEALNLMPQYRRDEIVATAESNRRKMWYWLTETELYVETDTGTRAPPADQDRLARLRADARASLANATTSSASMLAEIRERLAPDLTWLGAAPADIDALSRRLGRARSHFGRWEAFLACLYKLPRVRPDPAIDRRWEKALGLFFQRPNGNPLHTIAGSEFGLNVELASVRTTRRSGPDGQDIRQLVIEVTQRRQGYLDPDKQSEADNKPPPRKGRPAQGDFVFRGGATVIFDLRDRTLRYLIRKAIDDDERLQRHREHLLQPSAAAFTYNRGSSAEPFALLHRS